LNVAKNQIEDYIKTKFSPLRSPAMRYSTQIKPISYVKANAAEIIAQMRETGDPIIITQNGEATAVLQDIVSYEATQETLAMLQIIGQGRADISAGRSKPFQAVIDRLRAKSEARE
jgi:prevent-host-death family protein